MLESTVMLLRWVSVVIGLVLLAGCGSGLKLVPVTGTVTIDGKPLAYKSLMFLPEEGTPGHGGGGSTRGDGTYSLIASIPGEMTDRAGVAPGRYRVIVFEPTIPIEGDVQAPPAESQEPLPAIAPDFGRRQSGIPAIYTTKESTPLTLDVPESGGVLDLKLASESG
jgi:hypothetical protein